MTKQINPNLIPKMGFTLIELLVVIAIIGILVTIVVVAINPQRVIQDARDTKKREELTQLKNSLQLYFNDFNAYPATPAAALVPDYTRALPDSFAAGEAIYDDTPFGEDRAGGILDNPSTDTNDDG